MLSRLTARVPLALKTPLRALVPAPLYGRIRTRRIRRYIADFTPTTITHDYAGFPLTLNLCDPLAEGWYARDWDEPVEIGELCRGRLRAGARVFDVGAHQGVVALILARIVGEAGSVVAVEAELHNAAVARRNAQTNGASNMTVVHAAAGAASGTLPFAESLNGFVTALARHGTVEVPAVALDDLVERHGHPDVVLIDVEGYEAHVLDGAARLIDARRTDFCVEVHSATTLRRVGSTTEDVLGRFLDRGYAVRIAVADDTPPGMGVRELSSDWRSLASIAEAGALDRRFFLVARPGNGA